MMTLPIEADVCLCNVLLCPLNIEIVMKQATFWNEPPDYAQKHAPFLMNEASLPGKSCLLKVDEQWRT